MSQMLKGKTSRTNLDQNISNFKAAQDKRNNSVNVGKDLIKLKLQKVDSTRKIQDPIAVSKINKLPSRKNPELSKSHLKNTESVEKSSSQRWYHKKTLETMAKLKFDNADEPHPMFCDSTHGLTMNNGVGDSINFANSMVETSELLRYPAPVTMSYNDCHIVNVLHTKVIADSNGFFANNLLTWYEKTFEKTLPKNWLDLLKLSQKFFIKELQNNIVIYAIEEETEKSRGQAQNFSYN